MSGDEKTPQGGRCVRLARGTRPASRHGMRVLVCSLALLLPGCFNDDVGECAATSDVYAVEGETCPHDGAVCMIDGGVVCTCDKIWRCSGPDLATPDLQAAPHDLATKD